MKTKKALAGLLGLLGSFAGFPFFTAGFFPPAAPFFTDNLHTPKIKLNQSRKWTHKLQTIDLERKRSNKTHFTSAFFVSVLDLPPFISNLRKQRKTRSDSLGSARLVGETVENSPNNLERERESACGVARERKRRDMLCVGVVWAWVGEWYMWKGGIRGLKGKSLKNSPKIHSNQIEVRVWAGFQFSPATSPIRAHPIPALWLAGWVPSLGSVFPLCLLRRGRPPSDGVLAVQ